jgi:hypothetical protein
VKLVGGEEKMNRLKALESLSKGLDAPSRECDST